MTATEQKPQHQGYANPGAQGSVVTFKMGLGEIPATLIVCDLKGSERNTNYGLCNTQMPLPKRAKE